MKQNSQTSIKALLSRTLSPVQSFSALALISVFAFGAVVPQVVMADQYQEQINALNAQNANHNATLDQLGAEAASLQDMINKLQAEINALQAQIVANEAKRDDLQRQILEAEAELAKQKKVLSGSIKQMYLEGEVSTLEMLASSKDLSEFVDQQQYRDTVQDKIKEILDKINALKIQLKTQKATVEALLKDQENMKAQVSAQQAEQNRLLSLNQAEQNAVDNQIRANQSQIAELRRQQMIANARFSGGAPGTGPTCGGGYPARWCEIPMDTVIDSWGMYNRECVSYAAFKVAASGRHMPYWGGIGNANQWDENARRAGIPVNSTPAVGAIAQSNAGYYGHVMYVEHVYGDGTIYISQYNANLDGRYSERRISAAGLNFIHF